MVSKLEKLKELKGKINIDIEGIENYPVGEKTMILANHNCLMDIFYLPIAIPEEHVSVVSSRLLFKPVVERQKVINTYLNAVPLEANGGAKYANLCLDNISDLFSQDGISLNIFPEGGYFPGKNKVYKGKTGASRILYKVRELGKPVLVVPVAIDIINGVKDIDDFNPSDEIIKVKILKPIDYEDDFYCYKNASDPEDKNKFLHSVIDRSMSEIANSIDTPYVDQYMNYVEKDSIILPNGNFVKKYFSDNEEYYNSYSNYYNIFQIMKNIIIVTVTIIKIEI